MARLDRRALLARLDRLRFEPPLERLDDQFEQVSLGTSLPALAGLTYEGEYRLAQSIALHLLGHVPEPDADHE